MQEAPDESICKEVMTVYDPQGMYVCHVPNGQHEELVGAAIVGEGKRAKAEERELVVDAGRWKVAAVEDGLDMTGNGRVAAAYQPVALGRLCFRSHVANTSSFLIIGVSSCSSANSSMTLWALNCGLDARGCKVQQSLSSTSFQSSGIARR